MVYYKTLCLFFLCVVINVQAQTNYQDKSESIPENLTVYLPSSKGHSQTAVIIFPGGGYHTLETEREGGRLAKEFNKVGVVAFVLAYTLPQQANSVRDPFIPLKDAQRTIKYIRENTHKWGVNSNKIGVMGFSAGGHLAATLGTHFNFPLIENKQQTSLRPDFMLLIYPVISFLDSVTHIGSRDNLIGKDSNPEMIHFFSNELLINRSTPITFLTHALDDSVVDPENSVLFYNALKQNRVKTHLKLYPKGEHGFLEEPVFADWFAEVLKWLKKTPYL